MGRTAEGHPIAVGVCSSHRCIAVSSSWRARRVRQSFIMQTAPGALLDLGVDLHGLRAALRTSAVYLPLEFREFFLGPRIDDRRYVLVVCWQRCSFRRADEQLREVSPNRHTSFPPAEARSRPQRPVVDRRSRIGLSHASARRKVLHNDTPPLRSPKWNCRTEASVEKPCSLER